MGSGCFVTCVNPSRAFFCGSALSVLLMAPYKISLDFVPGLTLRCVCFSAQCMTWTITWSSMVFTSLWQSKQL